MLMNNIYNENVTSSEIYKYQKNTLLPFVRLHHVFLLWWVKGTTMKTFGQKFLTVLSDSNSWIYSPNYDFLGLSIILKCLFFSYYYAIYYNLSIEIENDQAKYFIILVGLEFVIEREHWRKRTNCRNVTVTYKIYSRPIT